MMSQIEDPHNWHSVRSNSKTIGPDLSVRSTATCNDNKTYLLKPDWEISFFSYVKCKSGWKKDLVFRGCFTKSDYLSPIVCAVTDGWKSESHISWCCGKYQELNEFKDDAGKKCRVGSNKKCNLIQSSSGFEYSRTEPLTEEKSEAAP